MWNALYQDLQSQLDTLRAEHDLKDAELALAMLELLQSHQLSQSIKLSSEDARQQLEGTLWSMAWWIFVRAPWLQHDQLVLSNMTLDLVLNAQRSLDEALADLTMLEQAVRDDVNTFAEQEELIELMNKLEPLANLPLSSQDLTPDTLRGRTIEALELMRQHREQVDEARSRIMARLFDEFGSTENQSSLRELFTLEAGSPADGADLEKDVATLLEEAQRAYEEGEIGEALSGFEAVLAHDAEQVDALVGRGVIRATTQDIDGALLDLNLAIEKAPNHLVALVNRGLTYYASEEMERAIEDFTRALEQDDTLVEAWLNRSSARAQLGELEAALGDASRAVELAPGMARARVDRAVIRRAMGDAAGAVEDYAMATEIDPHHADAWAGRGFLLLELGELEAAKVDLTRAISFQPWRSVLYYNRGNVHAGLGEFDEAIRDYGRVLEIDEDDFEARMNRGTALLKQGDVKGALEDWDRLTRLYPHEPDAYLRRGVVLLMSEEVTHAIHDFEQALSVAPKDWAMREVTEEKLAEATQQLSKPSGGREN